MSKIHYNIPFDEYQAWPEMNPSKVKRVSDSLLAFRCEELREREEKRTASLRRGTAVHCAVLEPDELPNRYTVWTGEGDRRTKAYKEFAATVAAGMEILTPAESWRVNKIRSSVHSHPVAGPILAAIRATEVSLKWTDSGTGIQCKGRVDALDDFGWTDVKTIRQLTAKHIQSAIIEYSYDLSGAAYCEGLVATRWQGSAGRFIFVEGDEPFDCAVVPLTPEMEQVGSFKWHENLSAIANARLSGRYPGLAWDGELEIGLPDWYVEKHLQLTGATKV